MDKHKTLEYLRAAKTSHLEWLQKAKQLISGVEIKKDAIPMHSTECYFGQWFHGEGQILNALANNPRECMIRIEELHFDLHDVYLNIFHIYFQKADRKILNRIFGDRKNKIAEAEQKMACEFYNKLEQISKELINEINRLERRLLAVSEEKIKNLV